jgi:hypothetical protein
MGLRLCRGIRERYPDWTYIIDGDGGDENLKDYPIEDNAELTIRSVVDNLMLYQEGWGVSRIKHSLTYSGGLSRSYVRTYAPARRYGFDGFSPFTGRTSSKWRKPSRSRSDAVRRADAVLTEGRIVSAASGHHRDGDARVPERRFQPARCPGAHGGSGGTGALRRKFRPVAQGAWPSLLPSWLRCVSD